MKQCKEIQAIEQAHLKEGIPSFRVGDTLSVHLRIIEGDKERLQAFTGTVIARRGGGVSETIALYRYAYGAGIERVFMLHSPRIAKIEVVRSGKVRRSKLYNMRGASGKAAKVQEDLRLVENGASASEVAAAPVEEAAGTQEA